MSSSPPHRLSDIGLIALLSAPFLTVMGAFSVIVAAPTIKAELGAAPEEISAIVAGYGLAYAAALTPAGRLGDFYGRRRAFVVGLAAFAIMGVVCACAPTIQALIVARILQGLAAALAFPQVLSIIRVVANGDRERSRAFAAFGVALGLSGVAGQAVSGGLVAADFAGLSWRSVFLINVPIALIACPIVLRHIPETRAVPKPGVDLGGALMCAAGLALLLYAVIRLPQLGFSISTIGTALLAAAILVAFAFDQRRKTHQGKQPLFPTSLLQGSTFGWGVAIAFLFHTTVVAFPLALALYLQIGHGLSAWYTGLMGMPTTLAFLVTSLAAVRYLSKIPTVYAMTVGGVLTGIALVLCAVAALALPDMTLPLIPGLILAGCGQGVFLPPLLNAVLARTDPRDAGAAAGVLATAQQVGGAFGAAAVNAIYFSSGAGPQAFAFAAAAAVPGIAAIMAAMLLPIFFRGPAAQEAVERSD